MQNRLRVIQMLGLVALAVFVFSLFGLYQMPMASPLASYPVPVPEPYPNLNAFTPSPTYLPEFYQINDVTPDPPRKGIAAALGRSSWAVEDRVDFTEWAYMWGPLVPRVEVQEGVQYVPMFPHKIRGDYLSTKVPYVPTGAARTPNHHYWLMFNECENQSFVQCHEHPEAVAEAFDDMVNIIRDADPQAKLIVGGVNAHPCGLRWLRDFVDAYRNLTENPDNEPPDVDGWHFHIYPEVYPQGWDAENDPDCTLNSPDTINTPPPYEDLVATATTYAENHDDEPTPFKYGAYYQGWHWSGVEADGSPHIARAANWEEDFYHILELFIEYDNGSYADPDDEIWITEMGCLEQYHTYQMQDGTLIDCSDPEYMADFVEEITNWLNAEGQWVTRYAWYTDYSLMEKDNHGYHFYNFTPTPYSTPLPLPPCSSYEPPHVPTVPHGKVPGDPLEPYHSRDERHAPCVPATPTMHPPTPAEPYDQHRTELADRYAQVTPMPAVSLANTVWLPIVQND